jgi:hypothetical protein
MSFRRNTKAGFLLGAALAALGLLAAAFLLPQFTTVDYAASAPAVVGVSKVSVPVAQEPEPEPVVHLPTPEPVRALYMTSWIAATPSLREKLVKTVEETEANALVIDVKDYTGRVAFAVQSKELQAIGSADGRVADLPEFLAALHEKGIYLIARVAVFQDPYLAEARPDLAVVRASDGAVWKDFKGVKWVDPASREVWEYHVALAREAYEIGFDEINFDYIRFPSDGNMRDIAYQFFDEGQETKAEVMGRFFAFLREELADLGAPLSADLFGMTTTNTDDLNIGQVLETAARHFDYIAPMVYPSHYPTGFIGIKNPAAAPYEVIHHSMSEAARRLTVAGYDPKMLRPWLQDFHLGATYSPEMIREEKRATYDSGLTSWMMWSPSNQYTRGALD